MRFFIYSLNNDFESLKISNNLETIGMGVSYTPELFNHNNCHENCPN